MDFHYDRKNLNDAHLWIGTVVDRADPLGLGRVRVRVAGYYSEDIDVKHLPWAVVLQNVTIGGVSSVGKSPAGLMVGAKVLGVWGDYPDCQIPIVLGIIPQFEGSWEGSAFDTDRLKILAQTENGTKAHDWPDGLPAAVSYVGHYPSVNGRWNPQIVRWLQQTPGNPDDEIIWAEAFVRAVAGSGDKIMKFKNPPRTGPVQSHMWCIYLGSNRDRIYGVAAVSPTRVAIAGFSAKRLVS